MLRERPARLSGGPLGAIRSPTMVEQELAKLVNRSGFLFQLAAEEFVRRGALAHGWDVVAREYPWSTADHGRSGFIDFIAEKDLLRCVFECKRTQGGEWIFLVPEESVGQTLHLRTLWSAVGKTGQSGWGWDDLGFNPASLCAEFCIVRGASDEDRPMLERIAGDLVRASESLATEELGMVQREPGVWGYVPVLLTNATLYACRVDPSKVNLQKGTLPDSATFEEVPFIRFRKSLPTQMEHAPETYESIRKGLFKKERSAFVVGVPHLDDFLGNLRLTSRSVTSAPFPWARLLE